jgi:hypothetical protein
MDQALTRGVKVEMWYDEQKLKPNLDLSLVAKLAT